MHSRKSRAICTSGFFLLFSCNAVAFARGLLDPAGSMDEFEREWTSIEQIYLESTFDVLCLLFICCLLMDIVYCFVMFLCSLTTCHVAPTRTLASPSHLSPPPLSLLSSLPFLLPSSLFFTSPSFLATSLPLLFSSLLFSLLPLLFSSLPLLFSSLPLLFSSLPLSSSALSLQFSLLLLL